MVTADIGRPVPEEGHQDQHDDPAHDADRKEGGLPRDPGDQNADDDSHHSGAKPVGCLQQSHSVAQVGPEPIRGGGDDGNIETGAGYAQKQTIGYPEVPNLGDHAGQKSTDGEGGYADQDDFARSITVGAVAAEGTQQSAGYAGQGVGQSHRSRAPAHVLFQGNYEDPKGLPDGTAGHVHEGRDSDDYPSVVEAASQAKGCFVSGSNHGQHSFCACDIPLSIDK